MAEWVPPAATSSSFSSSGIGPPPPPPPLPPLPLPPGRRPPTPPTYVVQVPKEQIYRVPPPENAYLVEHYRKSNDLRRQRTFPPCLAHTLYTILFIAALILTAALVFYIVVRPGLPEFAVKGVAVRTAAGQKPEYDITLNSHNPSAKMGFAYGGDGKAALSLRGVGIASGKPPEFLQGYRNVTSFKLVLRGSSNGLPTSSTFPLSLSIEYPVRLKIGAMSIWTMSMAVDCDVKMSALDKAARIASQECGAKLRLW